MYLYSNSASLSSSRITSTGGTGGTCTCSSSYRGGKGGVGRIGVRANTVSGSTSPTYVKLVYP